MLVQHKQQVQLFKDNENKSNHYNLFLNYYFMIPNVDLTLINQEFVQNRLDNLEASYIDTIIKIISGTQLIKACEDGLKEDINDTRREALNKALEENKFNKKANEEALVQLNYVITETRKFLTK